MECFINWSLRGVKMPKQALNLHPLNAVIAGRCRFGVDRIELSNTVNSSNFYLIAYRSMLMISGFGTLGGERELGYATHNKS